MWIAKSFWASDASYEVAAWVAVFGIIIMVAWLMMLRHQVFGPLVICRPKRYRWEILSNEDTVGALITKEGEDPVEVWKALGLWSVGQLYALPKDAEDYWSGWKRLNDHAFELDADTHVVCPEVYVTNRKDGRTYRTWSLLTVEEISKCRERRALTPFEVVDLMLEIDPKSLPVVRRSIDHGWISLDRAE